MKRPPPACFAHISAWLLASSCLLAFNTEEIARFNLQLNSTDVGIRSAAMADLSKQIAKALRPGGSTTGSSHGNEVLPVLARALQDPSEVVRTEAAATFAIIAISTHRVTLPQKTGAPDIPSYEPLRGIFLKAFSDTDEQVRMNAIRSYMLTYSRTSEVEDLLIQKYAGESSKEAKRLILDAIAIDPSDSPKVTAFLGDQLQDEKYAYEVAKVIHLRKRLLPPEALPVLADRLTQTKSAGAREMFAFAIGEYGQLAGSYLPLLESLVLKETDSVVKGNMQRVIDRLKQAAQSPPVLSPKLNLNRVAPQKDASGSDPNSSTAVVTAGESTPLPGGWGLWAGIAALLAAAAGWLWLRSKGKGGKGSNP
jgi:hypothetical protein